MFNNIGGKIKGMAKFFCWAGIFFSVVLGFTSILNVIGRGYNTGGGVVMGILSAAAGAIASWLGSLVLYGFGQLVDDVSALRRISKPEQVVPNYSPQNKL